MKKLASIILLTLGLLGCGPSPEQVAGIQSAEREFQRQARAGSITWADYARETNRLVASPNPAAVQRPEAQAFLAYRVMLAAEVDAKRMTPEQFDYLWRQRLAEIEIQENARRQAALASMAVGLSQAGAALSPRPATTFNCTTTRLLSTLQTTCD